MNINKARAAMIRHSMQMNAALSSDNPYHGQHIQQFCEYAYAVSEGAAEEDKRDIPPLVLYEVQKQMSSRKIEIEVDKQSVKKSQKAIDDLLLPLKRFFK